MMQATRCEIPDAGPRPHAGGKAFGDAASGFSRGGCRMQVAKCRMQHYGIHSGVCDDFLRWHLKKS